MIAWSKKHNDTDFSSMVNHDIQAATQMPPVVDQVKQFVTILADISLDHLLEESPTSPLVEVEYISGRITFPIPLT